MLDSRKREIRIKADYFRVVKLADMVSLICSKNVKEWVIN